MNLWLHKFIYKSRSISSFASHEKKLVTSFPRIVYGQNVLTQLAMEISDGRESLSSEINTDGSLKLVIPMLLKMILRLVILESRSIKRKN